MFYNFCKFFVPRSEGPPLIFYKKKKKKNLDVAKFKAFADNKFNVTKLMILIK